MRSKSKLLISSETENSLHHQDDTELQKSFSGTYKPNPRPTPYDFDKFIPFACLEYQSPETVTVTRIYQEDYVKVSNRRQSTKSTKSAKSRMDSKTDKKSVDIEGSYTKHALDDKTMHMKAYYNYHGKLIEVAIVGYNFDINKIIFQVFSMTLPYHKKLTKLTIKKGGLTAFIVQEIANMLPHSFLTDICLDDTYVPELNYRVLLQISSTLRNLSLNRCRIGDDGCKEIAASIEIGTPGGVLRTLELGSNSITDEGAQAIGDILRRNRHLLHLNLSGNTITDTGAVAICNALMEFLIRYDEIQDMKTKRLGYYRRKINIYEKYVTEKKLANSMAHARSNRFLKSSSSKLIKASGSKHTKKALVASTSTETSNGPVRYSHPELELKSRADIGEFSDSFDTHHVFLRDNFFYCVGNMYLCSLNLAYNNLEYPSLKKIHDLLAYQSELNKPPGATGLLRITLDGNCVPKFCDEYININNLLEKAMFEQRPKSPTSNKKHVSHTIHHRTDHRTKDLN